MKFPKHVDIRGFLRFQIINELKKKKLCGDELARIIGKKRGNKLTPGTIYPALKYLKNKKLLKEKQTGRKKIYSLTKKGNDEYKITKRIFRSIFKDLLKK